MLRLMNEKARNPLNVLLLLLRELLVQQDRHSVVCLNIVTEWQNYLMQESERHKGPLTYRGLMYRIDNKPAVLKLQNFHVQLHVELI